MGSIPLPITFNEIGGLIKIYDGIRYLLLFGHRSNDENCDRIKYLISEKSGITDSINHNFARIRIDLYNFLPIGKTLTFHNFIMFIKSVINKNRNNYCYNIFLERHSYKDKSNTQYF